MATDKVVAAWAGVLIGLAVHVCYFAFVLGSFDASGFACL